MIPKPLVKAAPLLAKLAVLGILVWFVLQNVEVDHLREAITIRHYEYLALALGCMLLMPVVLAMRLAYIAETHLSGMVTALFKTIFFNNLFFGQVGGDIYKIFLLNRRMGEKKRVLAVVFGDRLVGITALLSLSIGCILLGHEYFTDPRVWYALLAYLGIVLGVYAAVFLLPLPRLHRQLNGGRLGAFIAEIEQIRLYVRLIITRRLWPGIILTLSAYGLLIVTNLFIMHALGLKIDILAALLYVPVISIAVLTLPISINSLGVRESLYILFFQMAGYSTEQALAIALLYLLCMLVVAGVGGVLLLIDRKDITVIRAEQDGNTR